MARGDVLIIDYGLFKHYEICVCEVHSIGFHKALGRVDRRRIDHVAAGNSTATIQRVANDPQAREAIALRAESGLGAGGYNVLFRNCEHFVTWVLEGAPRSSQVTKFALAAAGVALIAAIATSAKDD